MAGAGGARLGLNTICTARATANTCKRCCHCMSGVGGCHCSLVSVDWSLEAKWYDQCKTVTAVDLLQVCVELYRLCMGFGGGFIVRI